jgi:ABC-type multidrug transport system fused ATPase/permease subunit
MASHHVPLTPRTNASTCVSRSPHIAQCGGALACVDSCGVDMWLVFRLSPLVWVCQFDAVEFKYAPELPSSLVNVSFETRPREKVGIVGRTGSGKSTLGAALFRIVELYGGRVTIDDVDVGSVPLDTLRSRVAVIPQVWGNRCSCSSCCCCCCLY